MDCGGPTRFQVFKPRHLRCPNLCEGPGEKRCSHAPGAGFQTLYAVKRCRHGRTDFAQPLFAARLMITEPLLKGREPFRGGYLGHLPYFPAAVTLIPLVLLVPCSLLELCSLWPVNRLIGSPLSIATICWVLVTGADLVC